MIRPAISGMTRVVADCDEAYFVTLKDVLDAGDELVAAQSLSVGRNRAFQEILHYQLTIQNLRQRLVWSPKRRVNLSGAVARFVWMMAANDRLKDIEFYWGNLVTPFSDDGTLILGSDYGHRMLNPRPGINQISSIINRLQCDPSTRRAAISIYQPEDAVRESSDIPCAFGIFFHIRNGALYCSVLMRSNNLYILLPYNMFEFSLLTEVIATELGLPLGSLSYSAISMHVFSDNYEQGREVVREGLQYARLPMPPMPTSPSPIAQIKALVKLEADARHAAAGFTADNFNYWLSRADSGEYALAPYWRQLYYLLLLHMAHLANLQPALDSLSQVVEDPWKSYLPSDAFIAKTPSGVGQPVSPTQFALQMDGVGTQENVEIRRIQALETLCTEKSQQLRQAGGHPIIFSEYMALRTLLIGDLSSPLTLAARNLDEDLFDKALASLRRGDEAQGSENV